METPADYEKELERILWESEVTNGEERKIKELFKSALATQRRELIGMAVGIMEKRLLNVPYSQKIMDGGMLDEEMVSRNSMKNAIIAIESDFSALSSMERDGGKGKESSIGKCRFCGAILLDMEIQFGHKCTVKE